MRNLDDGAGAGGSGYSGRCPKLSLIRRQRQQAGSRDRLPDTDEAADSQNWQRLKKSGGPVADESAIVSVNSTRPAALVCHYEHNKDPAKEPR
jgi:hypothetical protein